MKAVKNLNKIFTLLVSLLCLSVLSLITITACSTSNLRYVRDLSYVEWRDESGIFNFRAAKRGDFGCGTIKLNGKTYEAGFTVATNEPRFYVRVSIESAQKLGYEFKNSSGGYVSNGFSADYDKNAHVISLNGSNVELFGVKVGKVRLKAYPVDKSEFDIWEILSSWSDSENKLKITNSDTNYFIYKCLYAEAKMPNGERKYLTFRWLPETSGFCIYERVEWYDYPTISDDTPRLAEGTYEQDGNNVTLYFSKDELLGLQGQSLYLYERG